MNNESVIRLLKVGYTFADGPKHVHALSDVSLDISKGEIVALVGPSGCGKSTLLRLCAGLLAPSTGSISLSGAVLGMVFQDSALFPWLTTHENIEFGLRMRGMSEKERHQISQEMITEMGLRGFEHQHPKALSGGMRQRVGVARALAIHPDVLLMDEPFSALDQMTSDRLKKDILSVWHKRRFATLAVLHTISDAVELADRIVVFSSRPGTIKKIFDNLLPRPRNMRSSEAYALIDAVVAELASHP